MPRRGDSDEDLNGESTISVAGKRTRKSRMEKEGQRKEKWKKVKMRRHDGSVIVVKINRETFLRIRKEKSGLDGRSLGKGRRSNESASRAKPPADSPLPSRPRAESVAEA